MCTMSKIMSCSDELVARVKVAPMIACGIKGEESLRIWPGTNISMLQDLWDPVLLLLTELEYRLPSHDVLGITQG